MKDLKLPKGRYVLAVSGGVDSMVLLHLLVKQAKSGGFKLSAGDFQLIVAHFNHEIRPDSVEDEKLVAKIAKKYNLAFEVGHGGLGPNASEDRARRARYTFLETIRNKHQADGIITAHHQDDLIETAFLNILRGTGRAGLSSIRSPKIYRPLLNTSKKDILAYAKAHKLQWWEDPTNQDTKFLRNYIRQNITPRLTDEKRTEIVENLDKVAKINKIIDQQIATLSRNIEEKGLNRQQFTKLPVPVGEELLMQWLRDQNLGQFDRPTIKRLATVVKTGQPGSQHEVTKGAYLKLTKNTALLG